jgi:hypothetical protein
MQFAILKGQSLIYSNNTVLDEATLAKVLDHRIGNLERKLKKFSEVHFERYTQEEDEKLDSL